MYTMRFPNGKEKAVTLSYDDGPIYDERLIAIMKKNGLKGTFNLNSGTFAKEDEKGKTGRFTVSQAKELYDGVTAEVAIHGLFHPFWDKVSPKEATYDIVKDIENLEYVFDKMIIGGAYPFGTYNDTVLEILKNSGIKYCRTTKSTEEFKIPQNWLLLHPTTHHKNPKLMELAKSFVEADNIYTSPYMFYLWGHSYEFNNNNDWEIIEEFAEFMGGRDDIWYATNGEIYDYCEAYKSLRADITGKKIYNPTLINVNIFDGEKNVCIPSGGTVKLS